MLQRIWRKNAINFQHCFILNLSKYVVTDRAKKCHKFPILGHFKVGEICRNAYGEKTNKFPTLFHIKLGEICYNAYGEKLQ